MLRYLGKKKIEGVEYIRFQSETVPAPHKVQTDVLLAPRKQHGITLHKRHITAFYENDMTRRTCIAPSCKGFSDISKRLKWGGE